MVVIIPTFVLSLSTLLRVLKPIYAKHTFMKIEKRRKKKENIKLEKL